MKRCTVWFLGLGLLLPFLIGGCVIPTQQSDSNSLEQATTHLVDALQDYWVLLDV